MCGIAGYLEKQPPEEILDRMVEALHHRGPDGAGFHRSGCYRAGMRRLSINDVDGGWQPLFNRDRTVALLYNGEIYNSPTLRQQLEQRGHVFRTRSDGEVICHLYDEVGEALFEQLDGMFAAALWSETEQRLILARDIPGEKPLYYASLPDGGLVFASELKSLVAHPGVSRELDRQALWDFPTFLWIPEPRTVYRDVQALPPGHLLIAELGSLELRPYRNRFGAELPGDSDEKVIGETRRVVEEAVVSRLLSDVPVGAFLSSGLDSSLITALAARHLDRLNTFTIGFEQGLDDPYHGKADETPLAEAHARRLGTIHTTIRVTASDFRESLTDFCLFADQPFGVSSGLGILTVARAAREAGIKVLLSGDGADESFGGYSWYEHLPGPAAGAATDGGQRASFQDFGMPLEQRLERIRALPAAERAWAWHYYASEQDKRRLFAREPFETVGSSLRHFEQFDPSPSWTPDGYIRQDRQFYFPNEMLRKVDRLTMAHSVEGRVPFAAPSVLALAEQLEYGHRVRGGQLKWVLRRAFDDLMHAETLNRPKHGFNVPIDHWLKGEWEELMTAAFSPSSALHRLGLTHDDSLAAARELLWDPVRLHGHTIFCYIMLNMWLEQTT